MSCFVSCGKEEQEEIYSPTISEIVDAQQADKHIFSYFRCGGGSKFIQYKLSVVKDTKIVTENGKIKIPFCLKKTYWHGIITTYNILVQLG